MARWFSLELDTAAPDVTWGTPTGGEPGTTLTVPYTVNEPGIISAVLIDVANRSFPLTVGATELTGEMPADQFAGNAQVRATVKDDVFNEGIETLALTLTGVPYVPTESVGGAEQFVLGGGRPAFVTEVDRFDGTVIAVTVGVDAFSATVSGQRLTRADKAQFSGFVSSASRDILRFSGERGSNLTLAQIRQEDDEILALL